MTPSQIPFTKMQGLGNDFVIFEEKYLPKPLTPSQIQWISDRRHGIGCDLIMVTKDSSIADCEVSFFNADGSSALACGNGTRCIAKYLGKEEGTIKTPSFLTHFWRKGEDIQISLKEPTFNPPISLPSPLEKGHLVDVGNNHLVVFTETVDAIPLEDIAPTLQLPKALNVEVVEISHLTSPSTVKVRVWEIGVGITPACGSGACAVGALCLQLGLIKESPVLIDMEGGRLKIDWEEGKALLLTGPAEFCFKGTFDLP
jgi:diaminopimelate epimerase